MKITKSIIENGIYGLAIGDALGVPYEFMSREDIAEFPCLTMMAGGTHEKPVGTWSDDTSLTLATLDGLSEMKDSVDYSTIMSKFHAWLNQGEYTIDGVFDVGRATMQAIFKYEHGISAVECGGKAVTDNGNGSLMRILPAVLYSLAKFNKVDYELIDNISALTHGHAISKVACRIYSDIVQSILVNGEKDKILKDINIHGQEEFARLQLPDFSLLPADEIKSSGYVVDTLEAALWCFLNTDTFEDCVLLAVNLGNDTDTVAAVAGSIAGLYYGRKSIPTEWMNFLRGKDLIDGIIQKFQI